MAQFRNLVLVLGDQLSHEISSLTDFDKDKDVILICEVMEEASYVRHHKKKIAFLFSAMRHFAKELEDQGYNIRYTKLDDKDNAGSFKGEVKRALADFKPQNIVVTFPGEYRVYEDMKGWEAAFNCPVEIREDDRFLCTRQEFKEKWQSS